jgi:hypothetical protein
VDVSSSLAVDLPVAGRQVGEAHDSVGERIVEAPRVRNEASKVRLRGTLVKPRLHPADGDFEIVIRGARTPTRSGPGSLSLESRDQRFGFCGAGPRDADCRLDRPQPE